MAEVAWSYVEHQTRSTKEGDKSMLKEKPILFSTPMVQAILAGRKTMTRRVIKSIGNEMHYKQLLCDWGLSGSPELKDGILSWELQTEVDDSHFFEYKCPWQIGQTLWVRETWYTACNEDDCNEFNNCQEGCKSLDDFNYKADRLLREPKWRPSIFMPRVAARLFLKVTSIRVERLQDITVEDIRAEGLSSMGVHCLDKELAIPEWISLWNNLNVKRGYGWDLNPWVWVIEFERVEEPKIC